MKGEGDYRYPLFFFFFKSQKQNVFLYKLTEILILLLTVMANIHAIYLYLDKNINVYTSLNIEDNNKTKLFYSCATFVGGSTDLIQLVPI